MLNSTCKKLSFVVLAAFAANAAFAFDVTNNTLVGLTGSAGSHELVEYDFAGNIMETLAVTGLAGNGVGVAVIGNRVFVSDTGGVIGEVNLTTGAMFNTFNSSSNEGLGDDGTNLLGLTYNSGSVERFTTAGGSLGSVGVATGGTGVDGDATGFWVGMYDTVGNALRYDNAGNLITTVTTGIGSSSVSALGWDSAGGNLWIATGFGDDRIRAFDLGGNLLANFDSQRGWINGLDVVTDAVPEPATMAVLAVGGLLAARRRRK